MTELETFVIDVVLALVTLVGTTALLWAWFRWLAGRAGLEATTQPPRARRTRSSGPDLRVPSASPEARAEIAALEALWKLSRGDRDARP